MDLSNLFSFKLWFNTNPGPLLSSSVNIVLGVFVLLLVLAIVAKIFSNGKNISKAKALFWNKLSHLFFWTDLVLLILLFFSREGVPILGMRLWYLVLFAVVLVWLGFIIRYAKVELPKQEELKKEREKFNKYLPKKKNKK